MLYVNPVYHQSEPFGQVVAYLFNLLLQLQEGIFEIYILIEAYLYGGLPVVEPCFHAFYPFERRNGAFDGNNSLAFHVSRVNLLAGSNLNEQHGQVSIGHKLHRQLFVRDITQEGKPYEQHAD